MNIVRRFKPYCIGGVALFLCGCSSFSRTHGYASVNTPLRAPSDAASAVGAAPIGTAVAGLDPVTGAPATIKVTRAYDSAAGNACREYLVLTGSVEGRSGLACNVGGGWQEVAPLLPAQTNVPVVGLAR